MALESISITGTTGEVQLYYKIAGIKHSILATKGEVGIDTTSTDVTYTTVMGDVIATSSYFTITELPFICYKVNWKGVTTDNYKFNAVILGSTTIPLQLTPFPNTVGFVESVNSLNNIKIKIVEYKISYPSFSTTIESSNIGDYNYIVKVLGTDVPVFRIQNTDNTGSIYLHGNLSPCVNVGYTPIDTCVTQPQ